MNEKEVEIRELNKEYVAQEMDRYFKEVEYAFGASIDVDEAEELALNLGFQSAFEAYNWALDTEPGKVTIRNGKAIIKSHDGKIEHVHHYLHRLERSLIEASRDRKLFIDKYYNLYDKHFKLTKKPTFGEILSLFKTFVKNKLNEFLKKLGVFSFRI